MDTVDPLRFLWAFVFVLGLIGAMGWLLKRYGMKKWPSQLLHTGPEEGRIRIVEMRWLDTKRKLVLVRRDRVEHLLLLADGRETVIEAGIVADGNRDAPK